MSWALRPKIANTKDNPSQSAAVMKAVHTKAIRNGNDAGIPN